MVRYILLIQLLLVAIPSVSQNIDYHTMDTVNAELGLRHKDMAKQRNKEFKKTIDRNKYQVREVYDNYLESFEKKIDKNHFFDDRTLNDLILPIYRNILSSFPSNFASEPYLFISRSDIPNASCSIDASVIFNIGLLSRLTNHDQIAFVLAHELAHAYFQHPLINVHNIIDRRSDSKNIRNLVKEQGRLEAFLSVISEERRFTREQESQADSMALEMMVKAGYLPQEAITTLEILDSVDNMEYSEPVDLEILFNFTAYPFQTEWIAEPKSGFGGTHYNDLDTMNDFSYHPDIPERVEYLTNVIAARNREVIDARQLPIESHVLKRIDLEMINSSMFSNHYGAALYRAIQLNKMYPESTYVKNAISDIFYKLYLARKNHRMNEYLEVSNFVSEDLKEINIFLNNLRMTDLANIAFYYLNKAENFNTQDEYHYFKLWKLAVELGKTDVSDMVSLKYNNQFPQGRYSLK